MLRQSSLPYAVTALNQTSYNSAPAHPQPLLANSHPPKERTVSPWGPLHTSIIQLFLSGFIFTMLHCIADCMLNTVLCHAHYSNAAFYKMSYFGSAFWETFFLLYGESAIR